MGYPLYGRRHLDWQVPAADSRLPKSVRVCTGFYPYGDPHLDHDLSHDDEGGFSQYQGDIIFYDWDDTGSGDNKGNPDHVGIVEKVSGSTITVIEGNKNNAVGRRTIQVNGRYIRGYGVPKYSKSSSGSTSGSSGGLSKTPQWVGKVTATRLNVRSWAGTEYANIKSWPQLGKGNLVDVCDSVKASDGSTWYYIRIDGRIYGFVHSAYIKRA